MVAELSKLLVMIMVISLAVQTTALEPSITNNINTPGEDDQLLAVLALDPEPRSESLAPQYFASSPAYDEAFSPEYPSPAPDDHEISPPYVAVMAPEIADDDVFYSSAPTPTPATTVDSSSSQFSNYAPVMAAPDIDYGNVAPTPLLNVLPFTYEAEDGVPEIDEEELQGEFSHKKKGSVLGFVIFSVCLVGLGGFVYKKRKDEMRNSQYEYLVKRELEL